MPRLALLHTSPTLAPMFTALTTKWIPEATVFHMVDETLIKNTIAEGSVSLTTTRRLITMIGSAFEGGMDAVLVTCSSIGPAVEAAARLYDKPVVRVDEAMAIKAGQIGSKIGVVATLRTTLEPTLEIVRRKAPAGADIVDYLAEGAFEAVMSGDAATHDRLVGAALTGPMADRDVIVLAQASMARVLEGLPEGAVKASVLSSPELGVRHMRDVLMGSDARDAAA